MSTPDDTPQVPEPPKYGERLPEGQPDQPNAAGQQAQSPYGQPPQQSQSPYGQPPQQGYGQYGQPGQAPYGYQQPMPGGTGFGAPTGQPVRPKELNIAGILIWIAGGVMAIVGVMIMLIPSEVLLSTLDSDPAIREQLDAAGMNAESLVSLVKGAGLVLCLVLAALYVLVGVFVRKGSNGARITATVLAAISLLAFATGGPVGWVLIALGVVAVVLSWRRPSSEYIAARKAQKAGGYAR